MPQLSSERGQNKKKKKKKENLRKSSVQNPLVSILSFLQLHSDVDTDSAQASSHKRNHETCPLVS